MEKTHAPTPRRLRRALEEGDSPISLPLARAGSLVVFTLLLPSAAAALGARFQELLRAAVSRPEAAGPIRIAGDVALIAGPLLSAAALATLALGLIQTHGVVTLGQRKGVSLGGGLARLWAGLGGYDAIRGVAVTVVLLLVAARTLIAAAPRLASAVSGEQGTLETAGTLAAELLQSSAIVLVVASFVDLAVRRAAWIRRWRMSPRDVTDERRESEGDPEVKRARRRAHENLGRPAREQHDGT